jgi:diguanylate cyclase (GGDEF)-like protein
MAHPRIFDRRSLLALLALLLFAGFFTITLIGYFVSKKAIRDAIIEQDLPLTSSNIYSEIQKDLVRPVLISSTMAHDTFLRDWVLRGERNVGEMSRYLMEVRHRYGAFSSFFVSEKSGLYYTGEGVLKRVRPDEPRDAWYYRVRGMKEDYEINVDPDMANADALTIFINYRVFDFKGDYLGATGIDGILREPRGSRQFQAGGDSHILHFNYLPELKWYLFVEQNESAALAGIRRTLFVNLSISLAVTLVVVFLTHLALARYQSRIEEMASTDKLTGLLNRHAFAILAAKLLAEHRREPKPVAVLMADIDRFKEINDHHGHLVGDAVLEAVAQVLQRRLRASDLAVRWGGEEFLLLLKGCELDEARRIAEDLRQAVAASPVATGKLAIPVTISIGVSQFDGKESMDRLIGRADDALYAAKQGGRNRVDMA